MFDIGGSELLVIGVVALIVVGPKDLPGMFRTLGQFTAKARGMAREFQRSMEAAADEAGVSDLSKDLRKITSPTSALKDAAKSAATKSFNPEEQRAKIAEAAEAKAEMGDNTKALAAKRVAEVKDAIEKSNELKAKKAAEAEAAANPPVKPAPRKPAAGKTAAVKPAAKPATKAKAAPAKAAPAKAAAKPKAAAAKTAAKTAAKPAAKAKT